MNRQRKVQTPKGKARTRNRFAHAGPDLALGAERAVEGQTLRGWGRPRFIVSGKPERGQREVIASHTFLGRGLSRRRAGLHQMLGAVLCPHGKTGHPGVGLDLGEGGLPVMACGSGVEA